MFYRAKTYWTGAIPVTNSASRIVTSFAPGNTANNKPDSKRASAVNIAIQASDNTITNDRLAWQKVIDFVEHFGMMASPFDQRVQNGAQAFAERGEQVFDSLNILGAGLPAHQSMLLQRPQLL